MTSPLWPSDPSVLWRGAGARGLEDFLPLKSGALQTDRGVNAIARGVFVLMAAYVLYYLFVVPDGMRRIEWWPMVLGGIIISTSTIGQQSRNIRRMGAQAAAPKASAAALTSDEFSPQQQQQPTRPPPQPENRPWWPQMAPLVPMDPFAERQQQPSSSSSSSPDYLTPAQASLAATLDNPYGNYRLYDDAPSQVYTGPIGMPPDDTISRMVEGTTHQNPGHIWYTRPDPSGFEHLHAPVSQAMYGTHHSQAEEGWAPGGLWYGRR